MGWQDRDYSRSSGYGGGFGFGGWSMWSVTTWLIVINVAVYVLDAILLRAEIGYLVRTPRGSMPFSFLAFWGHFSEYFAIQGLQVWRFISFQFLHAGLSHLFFNMLALYFFGPMVESYLGSRRYLAFYLLCGLSGAVGYLLLWATGLIISSAYTPLVGASAGIFGVLIAAAQIAPNTQVMLLFPPIPLRLRTLAWIMLGIAAFTVFSAGRNAGGEAAHLGGAALGALLIRKPQWLNVFELRLPGRRRRRQVRSDDWWRTDIYR